VPENYFITYMCGDGVGCLWQNIDKIRGVQNVLYKRGRSKRMYAMKIHVLLRFSSVFHPNESFNLPLMLKSDTFAEETAIFLTSELIKLHYSF
jgi:hypothetical protein